MPRGGEGVCLFIPLKELRISVDSKVPVAKCCLISLMFSRDSTSQIRSKWLFFHASQHEGEAYEHVWYCGKNSKGLAETLLTKQAVNFGFRNVKRGTWKKRGEADQREDTNTSTAAGAPAPLTTASGPSGQHYVQEPETTTMSKDLWHLGGHQPAPGCAAAAAAASPPGQPRYQKPWTAPGAVCGSSLRYFYTTMNEAKSWIIWEGEQWIKLLLLIITRPIFPGIIRLKSQKSARNLFRDLIKKNAQILKNTSDFRM